MEENASEYTGIMTTKIWVKSIQFKSSSMLLEKGLCQFSDVKSSSKGHECARKVSHYQEMKLHI